MQALLAELSNLCVNVAAVQETHFTCEADCRVLEDDFVVYSAFGSHLSAGVCLLVGRSLDAIVNIVFAGDGGRLLVADCCRENLRVSDSCGSCALLCCGETPLLSAAGVVHECFETDSSSGGLECDP